MTSTTAPITDGRTVWICRHGDRIDSFDPAWIQTAAQPLDPPLSPLGLLQANRLGQRLKNEPIDRVLVSPFLRTLQTAHAIVRHGQQRFAVEHGLCEILRESVYPQNFEFPDSRALRATFPEVETDYTSLVHGEWPEDDDKGLVRCGRAVATILRRIPGNLLLVCHAGCGSKMISSLGLDKIAIPLCGLVILQFRDGAWRILADGSDVSYLAEMV